jgi:hypothetical protein
MLEIGRRSAVSRFDKHLWKELEAFINGNGWENSESNQEQIFWTLEKTCS